MVWIKNITGSTFRLRDRDAEGNKTDSKICPPGVAVWFEFDGAGYGDPSFRVIEDKKPPTTRDLEKQAADQARLFDLERARRGRVRSAPMPRGVERIEESESGLVTVSGPPMVG